MDNFESDTIGEPAKNWKIVMMGKMILKLSKTLNEPKTRFFHRLLKEDMTSKELFMLLAKEKTGRITMPSGICYTPRLLYGSRVSILLRRFFLPVR